MGPYSMDLRKRVARAWDGGLGADSVAAKYDVSRAWVHRLIQRRRETGSIAPRKQTKFRGRALTARDEERLAALITARPDATLTELRDALPTTAALATLWRTIERLGFTLKKNGTRRRATSACRRRRAAPVAAVAAAVRRAALCVSRRLQRDDRSVAAIRPQPDRHPSPRSHAVQSLGDAYRRDGAPARWAGGAGRLQRTDRQPDVRRLRRASLGPNT